jgi:hypothetical protein
MTDYLEKKAIRINILLSTENFDNLIKQRRRSSSHFYFLGIERMHISEERSLYKVSSGVEHAMIVFSLYSQSHIIKIIATMIGSCC